MLMEREIADLALDEVAADLVVVVLDRFPLDALFGVLLLLRLRCAVRYTSIHQRGERERERP
jgi:hypothetical protein